MCRILCLPFFCFRRRRDYETSSVGDDITKILIFGVTGLTGGAVMEAALSCAWFKITGFTRASDGESYEELIAKGIDVVTGDMTKYNTLVPAMLNIDCVFLTTTYWEYMSADKEFEQGYNVVNAALETGVKHLIYVGTEYSILTASDRCNYLEGKARVENYIVNSGIPYTIVHLGFFFENFVSIFKPHQTDKDEFAIALPVEDSGINCGSVVDFGHCVARIALRPAKYYLKTVRLATCYLTVDQIAETFNQCMPGLKFFNPKISVAAYKKFDFHGAEDLANMFLYYQEEMEWDTTLTFDLNAYNKSLGNWIRDTEKAIFECLMEKPTYEPPIITFSEKKWSDFKDYFLELVSARSLTLPSFGSMRHDGKKVLMAKQEAEVHGRRSKMLDRALHNRRPTRVLGSTTWISERDDGQRKKGDLAWGESSV